MAKSDDPYAYRRLHPYGQPHDRFPKPPRAERQHDHREVQANQFREDAHGPGYDNDVSKRSWLQNGDATTKPSFDKHDNAWRSESKGNTFGRETTQDRAADHNKHHSEFELHGRHGMTHSNDVHDRSQRRVPSYEKQGRNDLQPTADARKRR
jgi:hypothetical protein